MDLVQWPGQTKDEAEQVARDRPDFLYDLCAASMMQDHSDAMLERFVRLANLGDWAAAGLAVLAGVLPEDILPASVDVDFKLIQPGASQLAFATYAWRQGQEDVARRAWHDCCLPQAKVALIMGTRTQETLIAGLSAAPDCVDKWKHLAVQQNDSFCLEKLGFVRDAGVASLRTGDWPRACALLTRAVTENADEAACRMLLTDMTPHRDEQLLETLARHCVAGQMALGWFHMRCDRKNKAVAMFRQAGVFSNDALVQLDVMDQSHADMQKAARVAELRAMFTRVFQLII